MSIKGLFQSGRGKCPLYPSSGVSVNPLPTIGNSLKKQKSLYKLLTPSIKPPYKFLWAYGSL